MRTMDDKQSIFTTGIRTAPVRAPKRYTSGVLVAYGTEVADSDFTNGRSSSNCLGVLAGFRAFHQMVTDECVVGPELDGNFNLALSVCRPSQSRRQRSIDSQRQVSTALVARSL